MAGEERDEVLMEAGVRHGRWGTGRRSSWRLECTMAGEERDEVLMEAGVHHGR
jgi:hypothetical protein